MTTPEFGAPAEAVVVPSTAPIHRLICPTGTRVIYLSSPLRKNIPIPSCPKSLHYRSHPGPHRGRFAIVTNVGLGCDGRELRD
jgi:hypothetical protein